MVLAQLSDILKRNSESINSHHLDLMYFERSVLPINESPLKSCPQQFKIKKEKSWLSYVKSKIMLVCIQIRKWKSKTPKVG